MEPTGRDFVDRGLLILREPLGNYILTKLKSHYGQWWQNGVRVHLNEKKRKRVDKEIKRAAHKPGDPHEYVFSSFDVYVLLSLMSEQWETVFAGSLDDRAETYKHVVQDLRNAWAHQESFTFEEAQQVLQTILLLMERIEADEDTIQKIRSLLNTLSKILNPTPNIQLAAKPQRIKVGEKAVLSWSSENVIRAFLKPEVHQVEPTGERAVTPEETTTYSIVAQDYEGKEATDEATIIVTSSNPIIEALKHPLTISRRKIYIIVAAIPILAIAVFIVPIGPTLTPNPDQSQGNTPPPQTNPETGSQNSTQDPPTTEISAGTATLPLLPHFEEGSYSVDSVAKAKLINILVENDIEVITSIPIQMQQEELESAVQFVSSEDTGNREIKGLINQIDQVLIDQKKLKVGIVIVGKSSTTYLGQEANLYSSRATLDLRAVETDTWKVVASNVFQATEADISREAARDKALKALGVKAGTYLAEQISAYKAEQKEAADE